MITIEFAYMTHPGRVRKKNEDNLICIQDYLPLEHERTDNPVTGAAALSLPLLFGVFDGMGGEERGEAASYLAARTAARRKPVHEKELDPLCREMNKAICDYVAEHHIRSSGTTASMLLFDHRQVTCCHIGDSRVYRYRDNTLKQLTRDDVWPDYRRKKPPLLQCLGIPEDAMQIRPHVDTYPIKLQDIYVICTDGLSDMIMQEQIAEEVANNRSMKCKIQALMNQALEKGGKDNITLIFVRVVDT